MMFRHENGGHENGGHENDGHENDGHENDGHESDGGPENGRESGKGGKGGGASPKPVGTPLKDKINDVLTEARVILPGSQAVLGFQFIVMLGPGFDKLPRASQWVHLASLSLMALSTILLMTPAAYHRIVEGGESTQRFLRFASRALC